jgi:DNA-3-methyladenine glycosylase I
MTADLINHEDGRTRCWWPGHDPLYIAYHDEEWGVPECDSRALFEKLILDGFQAGLSWITILRKREGLRDAFAGFCPEPLARYTDADIERLMQDNRIIRNRAKIRGAIRGAQLWLALEEKGSFRDFLWDFVHGIPLQPHFTNRSEVPTSTLISENLSKALKKKGFSFCGPTITYAFMQAVGMTNDHLTGCWCNARRLQRPLEKE